MPHPIDIQVGMHIRQFRLMRDMTQREVAERVGVRMQQLQKYENGTNRVSASRMWEIAKVLGVPVSALFDEQVPVDGERVDSREARLLQFYRELPEFKQMALLELIESLAAPRRRRAPRMAKTDRPRTAGGAGQGVGAVN